jgi:hypothetical protein
VYVDYAAGLRSVTVPIVKFEGYFQSLEFFKDYAKDIRDIFLEALGKGSAVNVNSFIHVRGRDYTDVNNITHRLPRIQEYYAQAIKDARLGAKDATVITDDETYTKTMTIFQKFNILGGLDDLDALRMMAQCKRVAITANSTFSWWGAFLGNAASIYMPRPFLLGGFESRDIYYGNVKRIDVIIPPRKQVFEDLLVARRFGKLHLHMIFVRKQGQQGEWFSDPHIMINNVPAYNVQFISKERHNDIYNDMCIVKHRVATDKVFVSLNGVTQEIEVQEHDMPQKYKLVAMTMFKDDVDCIEPYVRHYRRLGVEHFYLYYNDLQSVDTLPQFDDVTYYQWPHPYTAEGMHVAQWGAMTDMIQTAKHVAEYVLFNDMDEYILWRPKHVSLKDFVVSNGFKVYACLNNFVLLKDPARIGLQIDEGQYEKTFEMNYPTRSKCIVNAVALEVMGIHKPMNDVNEHEICVLAAPMCEMLHICNLQGRKHVSLTPKAIEKIKETCRYIQNTK